MQRAVFFMLRSLRGGMPLKRFQNGNRAEYQSSLGFNHRKEMILNLRPKFWLTVLRVAPDAL